MAELKCAAISSISVVRGGASVSAAAWGGWHLFSYLKYFRALSFADAAMLSGILPRTASIIARCSMFSCVWKRASPAVIRHSLYDSRSMLLPCSQLSTKAVRIQSQEGPMMKVSRLLHSKDPGLSPGMPSAKVGR